MSGGRVVRGDISAAGRACHADVRSDDESLFLFSASDGPYVSDFKSKTPFVCFANMERFLQRFTI